MDYFSVKSLLLVYTASIIGMECRNLRSMPGGPDDPVVGKLQLNLDSLLPQALSSVLQKMNLTIGSAEVVIHASDLNLVSSQQSPAQNIGGDRNTLAESNKALHGGQGSVGLLPEPTMGHHHQVMTTIVEGLMSHQEMTTERTPCKQKLSDFTNCLHGVVVDLNDCPVQCSVSAALTNEAEVAVPQTTTVSGPPEGSNRKLIGFNRPGSSGDNNHGKRPGFIGQFIGTPGTSSVIGNAPLGKRGSAVEVGTSGNSESNQGDMEVPGGNPHQGELIERLERLIRHQVDGHAERHKEEVDNKVMGPQSEDERSSGLDEDPDRSQYDEVPKRMEGEEDPVTFSSEKLRDLLHNIHELLNNYSLRRNNGN